jgi:hypothetical protein
VKYVAVFFAFICLMAWIAALANEAWVAATVLWIPVAVWTWRYA